MPQVTIAAVVLFAAVASAAVLDVAHEHSPVGHHGPALVNVHHGGHHGGYAGYGGPAGYGYGPAGWARGGWGNGGWGNGGWGDGWGNGGWGNGGYGNGWGAGYGGYGAAGYGHHGEYVGNPHGKNDSRIDSSDLASREFFLNFIF